MPTIDSTTGRRNRDDGRAAAVWSLGLMSGTSMDGIDAALIRSDGDRVLEFGPISTETYDANFRQRLRAVLGGKGPVEAVGRELTERHAAAVRALLVEAGMGAGEVALIGFHGHTILHEPAAGRTWQIGDGQRLADLTGIDVVADFRAADVRAGGEGAPLAPVYHRALARGLDRPLAVLNLGGVGNVTWIGDDDSLIAFDTGPGNALIDDLMMRVADTAYDRGGALAAGGRSDAGALERLLDHPYFQRPAPKSLDRDAFSAAPIEDLAPADAARTLVAFTAEAVRRGADLLPSPPVRWLVTGGGRHNPVLMAELAARLGAPVEPVEAAGWRGDTIEAEAFAFMAIRSRAGLPISFPGTTGVAQPMTGGRLFRAT